MGNQIQTKENMHPRPRLLNIYNFIRKIEPRYQYITEEVLYETVANQIKLQKKYNLPATFALQYDALIDDRYQNLLKTELDDRDEIGAWLEIVQPQVEKAGIKWRGRYPWDHHANVGFSVGYTPAEREKLIDVYMKDFKDIFGYYPQTVGSWFIDAHSLAYLYDKYEIVASCNCKDQIGTDGYTLWGGYWNQAYYPSRKNSYIPAQNLAGQIAVPVFRMLGSDPVCQYDSGLGNERQGCITLEPVYAGSPGGGSDSKWVEWFLDMIANSPCLAFAYTQAGQENSFTWEKMKKGLEIQLPLIAQMASEGMIKVETLAESGRWYKSSFELTPATAVVSLTDWESMGHGTAWYNSRFYRINFYWEQERFYIRDLHIFDQNYKSQYLEQPLKDTKCFYGAFPVMDGFRWSTVEKHAGIRAVRIDQHKDEVVDIIGKPEIKEVGESALCITCILGDGDVIVIECLEDRIDVKFDKNESHYALQVDWFKSGPDIVKLGSNKIIYKINGHKYHIKSLFGRFESKDDSSILIVPTEGKISLLLRN